jgi:hypothetical protein
MECETEEEVTPLEFAKNQIPVPQLALLCGWDWKPGTNCRIPNAIRPRQTPGIGVEPSQRYAGVTVAG